MTLGAHISLNSPRRWFAKSTIVLFLNKTDIFSEKLRKSSFRLAFPDFHGDEQNYDETTAFLKRRFKDLYRGESLYASLSPLPHFACALLTPSSSTTDPPHLRRQLATASIHHVGRAGYHHPRRFPSAHHVVCSFFICYAHPICAHPCLVRERRKASAFAPRANSLRADGENEDAIAVGMRENERRGTTRGVSERELGGDAGEPRRSLRQLIARLRLLLLHLLLLLLRRRRPPTIRRSERAPAPRTKKDKSALASLDRPISNRPEDSLANDLRAPNHHPARLPLLLWCGCAAICAKRGLRWQWCRVDGGFFDEAGEEAGADAFGFACMRVSEGCASCKSV